MIPNARFGDEVSWLGRGCFDFPAQATHEYPKAKCIGCVRRPPNGLEQLLV